MGSSGKKRTTRAKLDREGKLLQKRVEKEARKAARRQSPADDAPEPIFRSEESTDHQSGLDDSHLETEPENVEAALHAGSPGT